MRRGIWRYWIALVLAVAMMGAPAAGAQSPMGEPEPIRLEPVAEGLTAPVDVVQPPDESGRLFVPDQAGQIWIIDADGTLLEEPFLDVTDRMVELRENFDERGLLGLAFHPQYSENGRFFVYYSAPLRDGGPERFNHTSHISEFTVSQDDPNRADPDSERIILEVDQPQFNHNGGTLLFGPEDGHLYISLGDGGGSGDTGRGHVDDWYEENEGGNAQNVEENLLGKILRIDVDVLGDEPYGIPQDNPFVDREGLDEIYAYGLRNPYRMSFDMGGEGWLLAVDAGQDLWEEVNIIEAGGNYGWNVREGTHCFSPEAPLEPPEQCPDTVGANHPDEGAPLIDPIIEFPHTRLEGGLGIVITAGQMYRGADVPELEGRYVFATWSMDFGDPTGRLFVAKPNDQDDLWEISELLVPEDERVNDTLGMFVLGVGQDSNGEVYILTSEETAPAGQTGRVWRLAPAEDAPAETPSETEASQPAY